MKRLKITNIKRKNNKGFTLVEMAITMVIIGILAVVSVPTYRMYVQRARASEGVSLVSAVSKSQIIYYAEHGVYSAIPDSQSGEILNSGSGGGVRYNPRLGIDIKMNSYFRGFTVNVNGGGYRVRAVGENEAANIIVEYEKTPGNPPKITVTYPM